MSRNQQYLLDLTFPVSFQEEDYIVTKSNHLAWKFIKKWPEWGQDRLSNVICIHGKKGAGKSHLASIWQKLSGAQKVSAELLSAGRFENENFVIDNIEQALGCEQGLFNLFNHVLETRKFLLITSTSSPSKLNIQLPDLRSRLVSIFTVGLSRPDDQLIEAIITKYFSDAQVTLNPVVIRFLVARIERSYFKIFKTLQMLDKVSLSEKRKISIPFIKGVLDTV